MSISTELIYSTMILLSIFIAIALDSLSSRLPVSASFSSFFLNFVLFFNLESIPLSHFTSLCLFQLNYVSLFKSGFVLKMLYGPPWHNPHWSLESDIPQVFPV